MLLPATVTERMQGNTQCQQALSLTFTALLLHKCTSSPTHQLDTAANIGRSHKYVTCPCPCAIGTLHPPCAAVDDHSPRSPFRESLSLPGAAQWDSCWCSVVICQQSAASTCTTRNGHLLVQRGNMSNIPAASTCTTQKGRTTPAAELLRRKFHLF